MLRQWIITIKQNRNTNTKQIHIIKHVYANSDLVWHVMDPDYFGSIVTTMLKIIQAQILLKEFIIFLGAPNTYIYLKKWDFSNSKINITLIELQMAQVKTIINIYKLHM